jgi:hypothetical protein
MTFHEALEAFTFAAVNRADSATLASAKADLDAAYRKYVTTLHIIETLEEPS